jgi:hypothetical protein
MFVCPFAPQWLRVNLVDLAPQAIPADFPAAKLRRAAAGHLPRRRRPRDSRPALHARGNRTRRTPSRHGLLPRRLARQMLLGWHYMEYYSNAYAMNQYLAARLHRAQRQLPQRHRLRPQLPRGPQLRRIRRQRIQRRDGRGPLSASRPDVDGARIGSGAAATAAISPRWRWRAPPNLFAAGVDMHGVHDWNGELPTSRPTTIPREHAETRAWPSSPRPWRRSPPGARPCCSSTATTTATSPSPRPNCLVEALRRQKVEFEELIFPDEIHDFLLRRDWVRALYKPAPNSFARLIGKHADRLLAVQG